MVIRCVKSTNMMQRGVRRRVIRVDDLESSDPHYCGFESRLGLWILSCEEAIQLAHLTSVALLRCPLVPEIMHGGVPIDPLVHQSAMCILLGFADSTLMR